jgi:hypothetical protein
LQAGIAKPSDDIVLGEGRLAREEVELSLARVKEIQRYAAGEASKGEVQLSLARVEEIQRNAAGDASGGWRGRTELGQSQGDPEICSR